MLNKLTTICGGLVILAAAAADLNAEVTFRYTTDQDVYAVAPGGTVPVTIYLQETKGDADDSLLVTEGGLFHAGFGIDHLSTPSDPASILSESDIAEDAAFTGGSAVTLSPLTVRVLDGFLDEPGPMGTAAGNERLVPLATLNFTAGLVPGETTALRVTDFDDYGASADTLTWLGTELDAQIAPSPLFSIHVIPEPSATALSTGLLLIVLKRRRHA